jgi:3,4-dihydroxy 2-butanone 4-phosphate synthase / GTP cyclohydrolase II
MKKDKTATHVFNTAEELIEDIRQGKMVILIDDEDRENEGDLVLAADFVTPEAINFMASEARGLICLALSPEQIEKLQLPLMVREEQNYTPNKTAFTVSIEASVGVSTGISAGDRAHTIRVASRPTAQAKDVHFPGHVFPIRAQQGGVLRRAGHTEGSVDLARLAGLNPAAVICEIMNPDGTMARVPDLKAYAKKHNIKIGTIVDLIEYRLERELLVEEIYTVDLPELSALVGSWQARIFKSKVDHVEHMVLQKGTFKPHDSSNAEAQPEPVMVRMQLDSYSKELFSVMENGFSSLQESLEKFKDVETGFLVLLRGNNKNQGIVGEIKSWLENHARRETNPQARREMDSRDYGIGAQILKAVGAKKIRLLSNNHDRKVGIRAFGIEIVEFIGFDEESEKENNNGNQNRRGHSSLQH